MQNKQAFLIGFVAAVLDVLLILALWNWVAVPVGIAQPIGFFTAVAIMATFEAINAAGKYIAARLKAS
jgi:hypothetical protein